MQVLAIMLVAVLIWLDDVYLPGFDPRKDNYIPPREGDPW